MGIVTFVCVLCAPLSLALVPSSTCRRAPAPGFVGGHQRKGALGSLPCIGHPASLCSLLCAVCVRAFFFRAGCSGSRAHGVPAGNKRMRLHFNKIGYSMYGKEQSRRVPSLVSSLIQCVFSALFRVYTSNPGPSAWHHDRPLMCARSGRSRAIRATVSDVRDGGTRLRTRWTAKHARPASGRPDATTSGSRGSLCGCRRWAMSGTGSGSPRGQQGQAGRAGTRVTAGVGRSQLVWGRPLVSILPSHARTR